MDADRFDALAKALGLSAARRGLAAGLVGGSLASVLASLETAARRHTGRRADRDDDLSAEKKHKKKCKKCGPCKKCKKGKCKPKPNGTPCSGGSCQSGACKPGDEAPPCTDESCPIPPGCSEPVLDDCTAALFEEWLTAVEPCEADCAEPTSAACRACLKPILEARLPDAEACLVESCAASAAARHRAKSSASRSSAREWWPRSCDKPTCCYVSWRDCKVDGDEALVECLVLAFAGALFSGGLGAGGAFICIAKWVFQTEKCEARYGCPNYGACGPDDSCCPDRNDTNCGGGECCGVAAQCCDGGGCCNKRDVCCRTPRVGDEGGEHYCCSGEHGLTCKASGPHSHVCQSGSG